MNPILWTAEQIEELQRLREAKIPIENIARALNRSVYAIKAKIASLRLPCAKRIMRRELERQRRNEKIKSMRIPSGTNSICGPRHIDNQLEAERSARLSAPYRDLAGALFGDPPVGYSALERRA